MKKVKFKVEVKDYLGFENWGDRPKYGFQFLNLLTNEIDKQKFEFNSEVRPLVIQLLNFFIKSINTDSHLLYENTNFKLFLCWSTEDEYGDYGTLLSRDCILHIRYIQFGE